MQLTEQAAAIFGRSLPDVSTIFEYPVLLARVFLLFFLPDSKIWIGARN